MPRLSPARLMALLAPALLLAAGCINFDPVRDRQAQTDAFTQSLARLADDTLKHPLSLDECVRIAMSNNYSARQADLRLQLNRIGRNVAFTAFLPTVAASAGYKSYAQDPGISEREFGDASIDVGLPIFMPSTWYLFAAQKQRVAVAEVAAFYIRQGIVLQTSQAYYNTLIMQDTITSLEAQLAAAHETAQRVQGLAGEGLVAKWEGERAAFLEDARTVELAAARRKLEVTRGELLATMGLSPSAPLHLAGPPPKPAPLKGPTSELVLKALEIHPELAMADRQVVISQNQVRQAFTAFLPTLSLYSSRTWSGNDMLAHSENWLSGVKGAWSLFNGLDIGQYKGAKVLRTSSELARESTFLTIMLQVISAEAALRNAEESEILYRRAFQVADAKLADYDAQAMEGVIPMIDALDARAERDLAQLVFVKSRYQVDLAQAGLELAMGRTALPAEQPALKNETP
jgi:outer membrane protein TolC